MAILTLTELTEGLKNSKNRKAFDLDGLPVKLYKCGRSLIKL
jgi:hypothetical protein